MRTHNSLLLALALVPLTACELGIGSVQVFIEAEDTIPEGLEPGDGDEQVVDGWTVRYDKFLVVVGGFTAARSDDGNDVLVGPDPQIVDLLNLPAGGLVLAEFTEVSAVRWDEVEYSLPNASADTPAAEGTAAADRELLASNGWSLYVAGEISKQDGQSCIAGDPEDCAPASASASPGASPAGTRFADCAPRPAAPASRSPPAAPRRSSPPSTATTGSSPTSPRAPRSRERRAQWIADADLDRDGETTLAELKMVPGRQAAFPAELGYNLSGAAIPIVTAYDYLEAQARTLGDFQGEGECPTREPL
jgi:hypothetical protein